MIKAGEIQAIAGKEGVRDTQIEKDHVISWVTYGIANNPFLKKNQMHEVPDFNDI